MFPFYHKKETQKIVEEVYQEQKADDVEKVTHWVGESSEYVLKVNGFWNKEVFEKGQP